MTFDGTLAHLTIDFKRMWAIVLAELEKPLGPEEALMVLAHPAEVKSGKATEFRTVAVLCGNSKRESLEATGPDCQEFKANEQPAERNAHAQTPPLFLPTSSAFLLR